MGRYRWLQDAIWIAILLALFTYVVATAADRALDPIIDTGRDLYIPEQIREGTKLYRDILYYYPPLAPYALAAITAVTGSSLFAYEMIGAAIALLTAAALYASGRIAGSANAGGAAALLFVACSVYSVSGRTSNYFFPYAHAATLAMLFFLGGLTFLLAYAYRGRNAVWLAMGVASLLAASWSKIEFIVFSALLLAVFAAVHRIHIAWIGLYVAAGGLSFTLVNRYFSDAPDERHWLFENVLAPSLLQGDSARLFYRSVAGFDRIVPNLLTAAAGAAAVALAVFLLRACDRTEGRTFYAALGIVLTVAAAFGAALFFRSWALLQLALLPFAVRRPRDPLLLLLIASICGSSRVLLNLTPTWYGFLFIIPTGLLLSYVLLEWLAGRGVYSRAAALLWIAPIAVIAARFLISERVLLDAKTFPVQTVRGTYYDHNPDRAAIVSAFLAHMRETGTRTLVVAPEGLALNYLADIATPISFHTFTPVETASPEIEQRIVDELAARPPERIAVVRRLVGDFGYRAFGVDYNLRVAELIRTRYVPERAWRRPGFDMLLLRRADLR